MFGDERLDLLPDAVPHHPHGRFPVLRVRDRLGVAHVPVDVVLMPGIDRMALLVLPVADGHDAVERLAVLVQREHGLGLLRRDVDADFEHRVHGKGVERTGVEPGAFGLEPFRGQMVQERLGHEGAGTVAGADEQDFVLIHESLLVESDAHPVAGGVEPGRATLSVASNLPLPRMSGKESGKRMRINMSRKRHTTLAGTAGAGKKKGGRRSAAVHVRGSAFLTRCFPRIAAQVPSARMNP